MGNLADREREEKVKSTTIETEKMKRTLKKMEKISKRNYKTRHLALAKGFRFSIIYTVQSV